MSLRISERKRSGEGGSGWGKQGLFKKLSIAYENSVGDVRKPEKVRG